MLLHTIPSTLFSITPRSASLAATALITATLCLPPALAEEPAPRVDGGPAATVCELAPIHFDFDEYSIRKDMERVLEANAACLTQLEAARGCVGRLTITGHTDERRTEEYSLALGERYARAARKAMIGLGVPEGQIETRSQGEQQPLVQNARTESDHQKNRRAEMTWACVE